MSTIRLALLVLEMAEQLMDKEGGTELGKHSQLVTKFFPMEKSVIQTVLCCNPIVLCHISKGLFVSSF